MSKTYHKQENKKLDLIVLPKNKFQKNANNFSPNNRYQNLPIKKGNYNQANFYNPLIYESFNKKGYSIDPSLTGNNILVINNSDINLYQNLKDGKSKEKIFLNKSGNTNIEIIPKNHMHTNTSENMSIGNFNPLQKVIQSKSKTIFSPSTESSSRWNNIGFKEIRYKNNLGMFSYDQINRNIFRSQNKMLGNVFPSEINRQNIGILNDQIFSSYNPNFNNKNYYMNYSSTTCGQSQSPIYVKFNSKQKQNNNRNKDYKNLLMNKNAFGKELLNSYTTNSNNFKTPDHVISLDASGGYGKTCRVGLNKKNYLSKNNPSISYNKNINMISDDRRKTAPRKTDYDYDINNNNNNKKVNRKTFLKSNDNDDINNKQYNIYKQYKQYNKNKNMKNRPLYSFENNNLKSYKNPNENSSKKIPSEKYINSVRKIQSIWKGVYVRDLMKYYWCLSQFKDLLDLVLMNHAKKNFFNYIKLIQNRKEKLVKLSGTNLSNNNKNKNNNRIKTNDYELLKNNLSKKEEDYNKLMKDYNTVIKKCDELKKINKEIKGKNTKDKNKDKTKNFVIDKNYNNFEIINDIKKLKKFINIKKEQKDEINIISNENNENNENKGIKLRGKRPNKSKDNLNNDNNMNNYIDYVNNFKSKLNVINNEQIIIEPEDAKEENNCIKEKKPIEYEISNYNLSLLNKNKNKIGIQKIIKIYHGEQINLINNNNNEKNKPTKILNNELIHKSKNNENISSSSTKDIKDKDIGNIKSNININYSIEQQKNDINIINIKRQNEFNKELLSEKNDISLNIINEIPKETKKNNIQNENNEKNIENLSSDKNSKNLEIFENVRISYENENKNKKKNSELKIFNYESILFLKENKKYDKNLIMNNTNNIDFKGKIVEKCDKMTEISNDLIKLEPDNHSELIYKGIMENKNKEKNSENLINFENGNNNNNVILKEKKEFQIINNNPNHKIDINKNKNYNIINEIEKADALEINPFEMRRTQNNTENIFISNADKMEFLNNKESIYNDKAKKNMMKIILPIRIKKILKEWIKSNIFKLLINNLKKISFITHILIVDKKYKNQTKKYAFEKMKDNSRMMKYRNYFMKEFMKSKMKKLLRDYAVLNWNLSLKELSKEIIANKSLIKKE